MDYDEFKDNIESAGSPEEQIRVIQQGVDQWSVDFALVTAELMEEIEKRHYVCAAQISHQMAESVSAMGTSLLLLELRRKQLGLTD